MTKTKRKSGIHPALPLPFGDPKSCVYLITANYPTLISMTCLQYYRTEIRINLEAFHYHAEATVSVDYCDEIHYLPQNCKKNIVAVTEARTKKAAEKLAFSIIFDKLVYVLQEIIDANPLIKIMRHTGEPIDSLQTLSPFSKLSSILN